MGNADINFTQGSSVGGAGFALIGTTGTAVVVSNGDDSGIVNWQFTVADVGVGSSNAQGVVQNGGTPTYTFTPDVSGCYVVNLVTTDNQGNLYEDTRVFGVLETSGRLIPSYLGTDKAMNFVISAVENTKGWSPFLQAYLKAVDEAAGGSVVSVTATGTTQSTGGSTPVISNPSADALLGLLSGSGTTVTSVAGTTVNQPTVGNGPITKVTPVTTTGATAGSTTFTIPPNTAGPVDVIVSGINATDGGSAVWRGVVVDIGGTVTVVTAFAATSAWAGSSGATTWTVSVAESGGIVTTTVTPTGATGATEWVVVYQYVSVQN
jgi:hypothetical protein